MKHYVDPEVMQRVLAALPAYRGEPLNLTVHPWAINSTVTNAARHYTERAAVDIWYDASLLRRTKPEVWGDAIVSHRGVRKSEHEGEMVG